MPSGQKPRGEHIRVRIDLRGRWIWEHVTADSHVVSSSDRFASREHCESDARRQGLHLVGCRRESRSATAATNGICRGRDGSMWVIGDDGSGIWQWRRFDSVGMEICRADRSFLSDAECVADARKHGCIAEYVTHTPNRVARERLRSTS